MIDAAKSILRGFATVLAKIGGEVAEAEIEKSPRRVRVSMKNVEIVADVAIEIEPVKRQEAPVRRPVR